MNYYTDARANAHLHKTTTKDTGDLAEGSTNTLLMQERHGSTRY